MFDTREKWLVVEMGTVTYQTAYRLQTQVAEMRIRGEFDRNLVLLLEHPPVFTTGKRGGRRNLIIEDAVLQEKKIDVVSIERGGDITYHGPGQLVGYLIVDIDALGLDIRTFVTSIEAIMCRTAADHGVTSEGSIENIGIWAGRRKLGSIGIAIRRGITLHGFSLNIDMDLTPFEWIYPCGMKGVRMTSLSELTEKHFTMRDIAASVQRHLEAVFNIEIECISRNDLKKLLHFDLAL